jgi:hypothetical protein
MFRWLRSLFDLRLMILDEPPLGGGNTTNTAPPDKQNPLLEVEFPDGIDDSLKSEPSLKLFIKDKKFNYPEILKSYVNAQKMIGKDKVVLPGKNATDDDWNTFYNKVGRPDLEKYEVKLKEGQEVDETFLKKYKEISHKSGLLPKQAESLFHWYHEEVEGAQKAVLEEHKQKADSEMFALKKDWGVGFDKEIDLAKRALRQFASQEEIETLKESGLTSNVKFVRLMNKIGKGLKEDSFSHESAGNFGVTKEEASNKISAMYADRTGPYMNKQHPGHKQALQEMLKLNEVLYS